MIHLEGEDGRQTMTDVKEIIEFAEQKHDHKATLIILPRGGGGILSNYMTTLYASICKRLEATTRGSVTEAVLITELGLISAVNHRRML